MFANFNYKYPIRMEISNNVETLSKTISFELPLNTSDQTVLRFHNILIEAYDHICNGTLGTFVKNHYALEEKLDRMIDQVEENILKKAPLVEPKRILRNGPALIVFWKDGTKTVVKCHDEEFDYEKGLAMALARRLWNRSQTIKHVKSIEEQGDAH